MILQRIVSTMYHSMIVLCLVSLLGCGMKKVDVVDHAGIEVPDGKNTKEIALKRMVVKIARGTEIGSLRAGLACVKHGKMTWKSGRANISDDEFTTIFYEDLKRLNYNVVGNPNELFEDKTSQAEFAVGGLITGLSLDVCYPMGGFGNFDSGKATATIDIEWQVYNALDRKTVFKKVTHGSANVDFTGGNSNESMYLSFSNALQALLADNEFYALVSGQSMSKSTDGSQINAEQSKSVGSPTIFYKSATAKDTKPMKEVQKSVVTVQVGSTHGSGFVIDDGVLLTNQHVVKDSDKILVVTFDGRKMEGTVIARDARRDVAAVRVDALDLPILRIRESTPDMGEDVYAIGSPKDIKLSGTVTKGVVSSFREMKEKQWIQSDATINHGSSGGPLVDSKGNVVGMSTLMLKESQGIYFFAPIQDTLATINGKKQ